MNRYKLFKAGVNVNEGISRLNGDRETYERLLMRFLEDGSYADMCRAIEAQDVKSAFLYAHSLKGVSGNLSLTRIYESILPLVEELRAGKLENAAELLSPVAAAYEEVCAALGR